MSHESQVEDAASKEEKDAGGGDQRRRDDGAGAAGDAAVVPSSVVISTFDKNLEVGEKEAAAAAVVVETDDNNGVKRNINESGSDDPPVGHRGPDSPHRTSTGRGANKNGGGAPVPSLSPSATSSPQPPNPSLSAPSHSLPIRVRRPWQWDWKRPMWHGHVRKQEEGGGRGVAGDAFDSTNAGEGRGENVEEEKDDEGSGYDSFDLRGSVGRGRPIDHAAAHVAWDEVRSMATTATTTTTTNVGLDDDALRSTQPLRRHHYVLTVTLLASESVEPHDGLQRNAGQWGPVTATNESATREAQAASSSVFPPSSRPPSNISFPSLWEACADSVLLELVRTDDGGDVDGDGGGGSNLWPRGTAVSSSGYDHESGKQAETAPGLDAAAATERLNPRIVRSRLLRWPASVVQRSAAMGTGILTERDVLVEASDEEEDDQSSSSSSSSSSSQASSNNGKSGGEKADSANTIAEVQNTSKAPPLLSLWSWGKRRPPTQPNKEPVPAHLSPLLSREGLVSACWCRLPRSPGAAADTRDTGGDAAAAAEDAMDLVRFLSLGLPAQPTPHPHPTPPPSAANPADGEWVDDLEDDGTSGRAAALPVVNEPPAPPRKLYLALLSSTGTVYLYSPWSLLTANAEGWEGGISSPRADASPVDADLDRGMAELWFGPSLFTKVHELYEPLSQPLHRLFLSVPMLSEKSLRDWQQQAFVKDGVDADPLSAVSSIQSDISEGNDDEAETGGAGMERDDVEPEAFVEPVITTVSSWDPAVWDSWVDQVTLPFRTRDNRPLRCVWAWDHLCVVGMGRRRRRQRNRRGNVSQRAWSDTGSFSTYQYGRTTSSWSRHITSRAASTTRASEISMNMLNRQYDGGFVTFFSMRTFAQVRTVFLPFVPRDASPFVWGGMSFLLVLGHHAHEAVAIRVDAHGIITLANGDSPASVHWSESTQSAQSQASSLSGSTSLQGATVSDRTGAEQAPEIALRRFDMLAIEIPDTEDLTPVVAGCDMHASPPCLDFVFVDEHEGQISVMRRSFKGVCLSGGRGGGHQPQPISVTSSALLTTRTIATEHEIKHSARFALPSSSLVDELSSQGLVWCKSGQGWSVLGVSNHRFFICWEGSTVGHGAFVAEIGSDKNGMESHHALVDHVFPLDPFSLNSEMDATAPLVLPFSGSSRSLFLRGMEEHQIPLERFNASRSMGGLDDIVLDALRNLSSQMYRTSTNVKSSATASYRQPSAFSHVQKSEMLLRQCSSWTQLEASTTLRSRFASQMPVLSAKVLELRSRHCELSLLSLRRVFVANGPRSPFQQVLSWLLAERDDFFAAASIALDLLRDGASLRLLWRAFEKIDEDEELDNLEGLLDGIKAPASLGEKDARLLSLTFTQLADMTVGCLTKGGYRMAPTLEHFLEFDQHYDASRASLMLVATAVTSVSQDEEGLSRSQDCHAETSIDAMIWPVRCLLKLASTRDTLVTALLLLNMAIPDELRRRSRRGMAASSLPSRELCRALITLIVASSPNAAELLLNLIDEASGRPFWESIDNETQLDLSLIETNGDYVLIRQPEVKFWIVQQLQKQLLSDVTTADVLPTLWLQGVVLACLTNAGCDSGVFLDAGLHLDTSMLSAQNLVQQHGEEIEWLRNTVSHGHGQTKLDYDVIVPVLLVLQSRSAGWRATDTAFDSPSTQSLLNAICYVAGRRRSEHEKGESTFALDMSTLMRQCALANNVQAGANLVGGSNGLVLECCDVLMSQLGISMESAESFLLAESVLDVTPAKAADRTFVLSTGHIHLMWLLECQVLDIRTYGDFDTVVRGRVDPVFASRLLFRSWYLLTREAKREGNECLTGWLREKLQMSDDQLSPRRLVCAALARALLWPTDVQNKRDALNAARGGSPTLLAAKLELPNSFLVSLTRSCLGLVEAIPPPLGGDKLMLSSSAVNVSNTSLASRKDVSFLSARNNSFLNESADDSFASAASSLRELDA